MKSGTPAWAMAPASGLVVETDTFTLEGDSKTNVIAPKGTATEGAIQSDKHLIVLHGWNCTSQAMTSWVEALQAAGATDGRYLWNLTYPTDKQFPIGATELLQYFTARHAEGHQFNDVRFLCYSMGGVVARQMIAQGFPVTKLATVCTPHLGIMGTTAWFAWNLGSISLKQGSSELSQLNGDSHESSLRNRYLCTSLQYAVQTPLGDMFHDDDQVVDGWSARAEGLDNVVNRSQVRLNYPLPGPMIGAPHEPEGRNPKWFGRVIDWLKA